MNNLLDLIQGADVEWKPLGEILVRTKGTKITAKQMKEVDKSNGPVKIFAGGKTVAFVNFDDIPEKDILTETSIIVKSRGIIEFEYYDKPFSHKAEMWSYHSEDENIDIKYVYYFLKMNEKYFQNLGSKMQMPQIATPDTDKYKIPIPSLEIQQKCVEILDKMTDYVTELTAELTLRQKQYSFYRDKLLTFPGGQSDSDESLAVRWTTLGKWQRFWLAEIYLKNITKVRKNPVRNFRIRFIQMVQEIRAYMDLPIVIALMMRPLQFPHAEL
ncbi:restriction endonuclease subunit S [Lactococcus protaetiae]|uniref:Restriction endonuclease subunit S n=1 Tax=Lactococcus protaetiae TaxID=2592653 RepID=A0A514Z8S0_9LACT|nr:restriction endonuclease subunit S [Lactococcus protaetiae]